MIKSKYRELVEGIEENKADFIGSQLYTINKADFEKRSEDIFDLECSNLLTFAPFWLEKENIENPSYLRWAVYEHVDGEQGEYIANVDIELEDSPTDEQEWIIKDIEVL